MADKVQFILEDVLDDAAYLVRKGVFSQGQLQQQMKKRERFEHALVNSTHRTTDHLKAIEFEYEVQRIRRYRQEKCSEQLDPRYRKASTKDFSVVKRIIRLWDRTMHRYRYRIDLWKEYLAFCYVVKSRKTFYKALSNAVKFNPFNLELWLAGVYYEVEANNNPWKARKVFHKALKTNRLDRQFWAEYLRFELTFAQIVLERQNKLVGGTTKTEIITEEGAAVEEDVDPAQEDDGQQEKALDNPLEVDEGEQIIGNQPINFSGLIKTVVEEGLTALQSEEDRRNLAREMITILSLESWSSLLENTINEIKEHLQKLIVDEKIVTMTEEEQYASLLSIDPRKQFKKLKASLKTPHGVATKFHRIGLFKPDEREKLLRVLTVKDMDTKHKIDYYLEWAKLMKERKSLDEQIVTEGIKELMLHKQPLSDFVEGLLEIDPLLLFRKLINSKLNFPIPAVTYYLEQSQELKLSHMDVTGVLRRIDEQECYSNRRFLCALAAYNKRCCATKANLELVQKLNRSYSKQLVAAVVAVMNS